MRKHFLPISDLGQEPYSLALGFPRITKRQLQSRIRELEKHGINKIAFWGPTKIGSIDVLGKGYVGVVVLGKMTYNSNKGKIVAIKIRRTDSQREHLKTEAQLLQTANKIKVGPKLIASSKNFLVMEYHDGQKIIDWIQKKDISVMELKFVLKKILQSCYKLDMTGLDHGELSTVSKHILIAKNNKKITIIDFDSSSTNRRVSNITSATQGLFIGSGIAKKISNIYGISPKQEIITALRTYKQEISSANFKNLLKVLKL